MISGRIIAVDDQAVASTLFAAATATDEDISVDSTVVFGETGEILIADDTNSETVAFTSVDRDTGVLELAAPLVNSYGAGTPVFVFPEEIRRFAWIRYEGEEFVRVLVPYSMRDVLPLGVRDEQAGIGEIVSFDPETATLVEVPNQQPIIDGTLIDPDTIPGGSDGDAPGSSPTPTVQGGVGYLAVRWTGVANDDPVTYEVHVSTTTGFTPSGSTLAGEIDGTLFFIRKMPDDSDLLYETTYFVKLIAKDEDGSASAGSQGSAVLVPAETADLAVGSVTAGNILSGTITAEQMASVLVITNRLIAGVEAGQRVEIDEDGIRLIAADGTVLVDLPTEVDQPASFAGFVTARSLTVEDQFRLQGTDNEVSSSAELNVGAGVSSPTSPPSIAMTWDLLELDDDSELTRRGLWYDSAGTAGGATPTFWYVEQGVGGRVIEATASTGVLARSITLASDEQPLGVTRVGSHIFVLLVETTALVFIPGHFEGRVWIPAHYEGGDSIVFLRKYLQSNLSVVSTTNIDAAVSYSLDATPGLGSDGTYVCVLHSVSGGVPKVRRYTTSPAFQDEISLTGVPEMNDDDELVDLKFFSLVLQGGSWWIAYGFQDQQGEGGGHNGGYVQRIDSFDTSGAYDADREFDLGGNTLRGTAHDGSTFRTISAIGEIYEHTAWDWTTESPKYWAAFSWYDGAGTTHETPVSEVATLTISRRAGLLVNALPGFPGLGGADDPDRIRVYLNRGTTVPTGGSPTRFAGFLQGASASTTRTFTVTDFDDAGSAPENPATSDFPSSPGTIQSAGSEWQLLGDGTTVGFGGFAAIFGDGSDGSAVFDGSSTVLGLIPSSGVYSMTRDLYLDDMQVDVGATVKTEGFRIFVAGTLTNEGTIQRNGNAGGNGSAAAGGVAGPTLDANNRSYPPMSSLTTTSGAGGAGGRNAAGSNGTAIGATAAYGGAAGAGGAATNGGGTGGTVSGGAPTTYHHGPRSLDGALNGYSGWLNLSTSNVSIHRGGAGGGGGGSSSTGCGGGGGGGGGGCLLVAARRVVNDGVISANGGAGGNGAGTSGNAGGGGGGGGGLVVVVTGSYEGNVPTAAGGAQGTPFNAGAAGTAGSAGTVVVLEG